MAKKVSTLSKLMASGTLIGYTNKKIKNFFVTLRKRIDLMIGMAYRKHHYKKGEIVPNRIFMFTFDDQYTCNPKAVAEEIIRRKLPVEIYWAVNKGSKMAEFPPEIRTVKHRSFEAYEMQASSKIWLENALNGTWDNMPKKQGQYYINTWHGSLGIKRLSGNKNWTYRARLSGNCTDYMISNSTFENEVYATSFWPNVPALMYGHPRNDIFFQPEKFPEIRQEICDYFDISPEDKIMLYAPTFRDGDNFDWNNLNFRRLKAALEKKFGGNWVILVRMHFKNRNRPIPREDGSWLKNAGSYANMQRLLTIVDAGITDYSSWAYDYILTKRPMFLYVPDIAQYENDKGFYYPLSSTPFPMAKDNKEMQQQILDFDMDKYLADCEAFLAEKGCVEDGHASERVVDKIVELMGIDPNATDDEDEDF